MHKGRGDRRIQRPVWNLEEYELKVGDAVTFTAEMAAEFERVGATWMPALGEALVVRYLLADYLRGAGISSLEDERPVVWVSRELAEHARQFYLHVQVIDRLGMGPCAPVRLGTFRQILLRMSPEAQSAITRLYLQNPWQALAILYRSFRPASGRN